MNAKQLIELLEGVIKSPTPSKVIKELHERDAKQVQSVLHLIVGSGFKALQINTMNGELIIEALEELKAKEWDKLKEYVGSKETEGYAERCDRIDLEINAVKSIVETLK